MTRRRYIWSEELSELVEVGADYVSPGRGGGHRSEEEVYGHLHHTDGTDLSTKKRHREFMRRNGLTLSEDYRETWSKAEAEKKRGITPGSGHDSAARRETIGRLAYEMERKSRR